MTIATKTIIPVRRQGLVRRQRLLDNLYRSLDYKLTLVTAAAGYGKTSLLVDFAHDTELPVCWLTLDEDDSDPAKFLAGVADSITQRFPGFGEMTRSALGSGTPVEEVAGVLINELVAGVPDFVVLILDDYHTADAPAIGRVMDRLLRFLPDHVRLIISGRALPAIDLIRLTAKQEIAVLVPQELCFTAGETAALLEQNHNLPVRIADAEALTRRMEGWVTGIILATQRLTRHLVPQPQPAGESLDAVYAYLAQEVLALQSPHVRDFLLQTAILRWMTADICDALLHRNDAASIFGTLETRRLFIERVGEARYRYHPLFREFLLEQLEAWDAGRADTLHRKAAQLHAQAGEREEAIRHWLIVGELEEATPLMDSLASMMFTNGRYATLLDWFQTLGEQIENAPQLQLYVATMLIDQGDYSQALMILEKLLRDPVNITILPDVQVQQGYIWYRQGQIEKAIEKLQPLIENGFGDRVEAYALRVIGLCHHRQGALLQAKEHLLRALKIYEGLSDDFNQSRVLLDLVLVLSPLGQMEEVLRYQARALEILRRQGNPAPLALALNNSACTHHNIGQFEEADSLYQEALANARQSGQQRNEGLITIGRADLLRDTGRREDALAFYQQALSLLRSVNEPWLQTCIKVGVAACYRMAGELTQARIWADQAGQSSDAGMSIATLVERGVILIALGRLDEGLAMLAQGRDAWLAQEAYPELAVAELRLGEAHRQAVDEEEAAFALERAIAATGRYAERDVRFVLQARHHPELLALGEQHSVNPPALDHLRHRMRELDQALVRFARRPTEVAPVPALQVFALGDGRVMRDGREVAAAKWERRVVARTMLFYLVDHAQVQRHDLIYQFWPDVPGNKATSRLHSALHNVRKAAGADWLRYIPDATSYQVDLAAGVWYDVAEFEKTLVQAKDLAPGKERAGLLRRAVDLYSGPYLADVDKVWVMERRHTLELAYLEALIDLGDCYYAEQDYELARTWYGRALEIDDYREDVHRRLILALAQGGRRAEALRQYEHCVQILDGELGVEPDPATRDLVERIRAF